MNENIISTNIARLRKEHGLTQDALASKLGVTYQAVSKWENGASCPDVMLLPEIADIFSISVDELFGRSAPVADSAPAPEIGFIQNIPCDVPWDDDGKLRVVLFHGSELMQAINEETLNKIKEVPFVYNGPALNISSALNIYCNNCDIGGDVSAAGNVFCGDVSGDVSSNGSVECSDVSGNVEAQGSVKCSDISGSASAGGNISCADISGNASCGGELDCGDVSGNVSTGGNITCTDINGDASAGGDITADEINGDITCCNVTADEIYGDVHAQGSVRCDHMNGDVYGPSVETDHKSNKSHIRHIHIDANNSSVSDDDFDALDADLEALEEELRNLEDEFENFENNDKRFSIKIEFNTDEFRNNVSSFVRKTEDCAKKLGDKLSVTFSSSNDADSTDDEHITDIINAEIDSAIDEAIESEDYDGISTRINDKMSKINDKINRYFNDKYGN